MVSKSQINIGISEKDRAKIAEGLSKLLADTYTLYLTTHNFHWKHVFRRDDQSYRYLNR